jgi:hypothetical protein
MARGPWSFSCQQRLVVVGSGDPTVGRPLLACERGRTGPPDVIADGDDLLIATITVTELRTGIQLASAGHRVSHGIVKVLETLPVEPHNPATAEAYERLLAQVHRGGANVDRTTCLLRRPRSHQAHRPDHGPRC